MIGLPPHQTWGVWVPPSPRTVGAFGTPKGKSGKCHISSIPAAQAEYSATNVISSVGAVAAVKRLPCQISQFAPYSSQGGHPKGLKCKISYVSSVPAAHVEYTTTNVIPPIGAVADVKNLPCHISQFAPTFHRGRISPH